MYTKLLNAIYIDRNNFDNLHHYVNSSDFDGAARVLYDYAVDYYEKDAGADHIDSDIILHKLQRNAVKNVSQYKDILYGFTDNLSTINIKDELLQFKMQQTEDSLIQELVSDNPDKRATVRELMNQYNFYDEGNIDDADSAGNKIYNNVDVADILDSFSEEKLIKLYPASLNSEIGGGVIPQTHAVIFARPEVGKSLFTINMAASMARNGHKVLFIEMEDPTDATVLRFISNLTGFTRDDLRSNPDLVVKARALLKARGYENVVVAETDNGTVADIERLIQQHEPEVVFINQLRQIAFKGVDGEVQKLAMAGNSMRRLAKKYDIVVFSIHQAAETGDGKVTLDLRDMYMSKTALQGDVDLAIGVGCNQQFVDNGRRMLSVCKNKNGWHGRVPVDVEETLTRVRSIK